MDFFTYRFLYGDSILCGGSARKKAGKELERLRSCRKILDGLWGLRYS